MLNAFALAEKLVAARYEDLPKEVRHAARRCMYDVVACAAAGQTQAPIEAAHEYTRSWFRDGVASVWFRKDKMSSQAAAFVNSYAASILDIDDGHRAASGHPGAAVVPAVLAAAECEDSTLQDVLLAIVCGYEAGVGIAKARDAPRLLSVATGRWSAVAVAAALAKLKRFDAARMAHAISIAEAQAPNLLAADHAGFAGSDTKEGIPWSVITGMAACDQAALGLRGYLTGLDNPQVYCAGPLASERGAAWLIETTYFKLYGCCRWAHSAIEAIAEMRRAGLDSASVSDIEVSTFQRALSLENAPAPSDLISAQFSLPFTVAVALVDGDEALQPLNAHTLGRNDIIRVAERVKLRFDSELNSFFPAQIPARVTVRTRAQSFEREIRIPLGDPANPITDARLVQKAIKLCSGVRSEGEVHALAEQLIFLPERESVVSLRNAKVITNFLS